MIKISAPNDKYSETISKIANDWTDIRIISSNASKNFNTKLDIIYKSMDSSGKSELDPVDFLLNQDAAEKLQQSLFEEIKDTENKLVTKYNSIISKLGDTALIAELAKRSTDNTLPDKARALFGDNPEIAADNLRREMSNIKLEFDTMKATIIRKSVTLSRSNEIRELKNRFEFSIKKMDSSTEKTAYVGEIIQYGYSLANVYKEISDEFKEKSQNQAYKTLEDVLKHNYESFQLKAYETRLLADAKALPGIYQRLGLDTKPSGDVPSTVSLSGVKLNMKRFAKDDLKTAKNRYTEYWDNLMMQSLDPVELGTIVYEKPKHGDKTIEEEQKLHGTKFKKKLMEKSKPRFKKDK